MCSEQVYNSQMEIVDQLLESWDRQSKIVDAVASLVTEENRHFKPSEDGMPLDAQLVHMHGVRRFFLSQVSPSHFEGLPRASKDDQGTPLDDLDEIRVCLKTSQAAVRAAVKEGLETGGPMKSEHVTYDSPVLLMQHLVWHDGWHVGLIFLALRLNGQEPLEEWEEPNVWGQWRTETW